MRNLSAIEVAIVSGGISDADAGSGLNYGSSGAEIESNVAARASFATDVVSGLAYAAGICWGLL